MHHRKIPVDIVEIDSGSEDEGKGGALNSAGMTTAVARIISSGSAPSSIGDVESRTFWKAGNYEVGPLSKFTTSPDLLEHARVHPKFLHSNATSHKWAFGAIAELLDNAVDEVQNGATFVKIDKINIMKDNSPALLVQDDGGGMDPQGLRKCMSLGYSSKKSNTTIGQYGNGFKTSTMRLGADVIVFSRAVRACKSTQSVGLLSYTFLRRTGQDDVIVPMIDFDISSHWTEPIIYSSEKDWSSNLNTILEWSPFASKEELMQQFEDIGSHGTKIIIYNLWLNDEGIYELSFDDDDEDIRLRDEASADSMKTPNKKVAERRSHISYRLRYSLRAYASILYLRKFKNFKILLRGKPIEQYSIADDLKYSKVVTYKPQAAVASKDVSVETTIGFIKEAPSLGVSGFNVYHKNRLIRPYWKVTSDGTSKGYGVVGVLEANFIEPAHDKQDFERSSLYIRLESRLKQILSEYWKGHCHYVGHQTPGTSNRSQKQGVASSQHSTQSRPMIVNGLSAAPRQDSSHGMGSLNYPAVSYEPVLLGGATKFMTADQVRDENIELYMRCQSHKQKQKELKEKIRNAEAELEDTRKKSAQLASFLETIKKQKC